MKDPSNGRLLFSKEEIKAASLSYCVELLKNNEVDEDYAREISIENLLHYFRAIHSKEGDDEKLTYDNFNKRLEVLEKENKDKYKFNLKSGQAFKSCIFNLFKSVWKNESIPNQMRETIIIQTFKGGHKDPSESL